MYNDGITILYFNTTGIYGGSENLKVFLQYLEDSSATNAVDSATKEVDGYVNTIKCNHNIGGMYMTLGEMMDKIVEEAVEEAVAEKENELAEKENELAEKENELAEKDAEIARLKALLSAQE